MAQYIVLQPISPEQGALIQPAQPTEDEPNPAPVLIELDDAAAARLLEMGVVAPLPAPPIVDIPFVPESPTRPRSRRADPPEE